MGWGWKSLCGSWAGHQKQRFGGGKVSRYLYQIGWIFLEASAWRNLLQDLWCCGMSPQSNSKALPHPLLLRVYLKRRHSLTESEKRPKQMEGSGSPLASSLTPPGKTDVEEEDGDMAEWSSSRSCDSAETPQWHRLQGTLRGHLTFNLMKATAVRFR